MTNRANIRDHILAHLASIADAGDAARLEALRSGDGDIAFDELTAFDSLDAVELCTKLETEFDVPVDVGELARVSTINAFADRVAELCGSGEEIEEETGSVSIDDLAPHLLVLREGDPAATPLFFLPGSDGSVYVFRDMVAALPASQRAYGLQPRGIDGQDEVPATIPAMAEDFLALIEKVVPSGPFWLVGYSGGGAVGFEIVRQLEAKGRRDARIVMLDSICPSTELPRLKWHQKVFDRRLWAPDQFLLEIGGNVRRLRGGRERRRTREEYRKALAAGDTLPRHLRTRHMFTTFNRAHAAYRPGVIQTDILIFRATRRSINDQRGGKTLGWAGHTAGKVEVVDVTATHGTIFTGERASRIAGILADRAGAPSEPVLPA